jgi:hypothetical protein
MGGQLVAECEIKFIGPEFDGYEDELGNLNSKLQQTANNEALEKFGDGFMRNPSDMQIMPIKTLDGPRFFVKAFHSTQSAEGQSAVLVRSVHVFSFRLSRESGGSYLRTDTEHAYPLDRSEQGVLKRIARVATRISIDKVEIK